MFQSKTMVRDRAIRLGLAILAIAFFATPVAAWVLGVPAEQFENRRFAHAPKPSQGWDTFQQTTRYLVDRMPLRAQAVRANTRIWADVLGTDPRYGRESSLASDRALPFAGATRHEGADVSAGLAEGSDGPATAKTGRAGWYYVDEDFEHACDTKGDRAILERWGRILRAIRASGRPAVLLVPPAKASVYPEYLPDDYPLDHCALAGKERFWRLLADEGPDLGVLELRSELVRLKAYVGGALFQRKDSHWSTLGALTQVRSALEEIGDGVRLDPSEIVKLGSVSYLGDLAVLGGRSERDQRMEYGIRRAPDAPRVPGRTLLIGDSFAGEWTRLFKPYFEHLHVLGWGTEESYEMIEAMSRSDRVIIESMEVSWKEDAYSHPLAADLRWLPPVGSVAPGAN